MTPELVLASASPTRRAILTAAGIRFVIDPAGVDEALFRSSTSVLAEKLARDKAMAVMERHTDALVLGCDSLLDVDDRTFGKPSSADDAEERWRYQRGRSGVLFTGHVLASSATGEVYVEVVATTVHFGNPTDAEIHAYVQTGEPLDKAGAFTLEGRSAPFIEAIEGDAGNVRGLSLPALDRLLRLHGWSITEFWT
jgi:septum formation protein